jgi:hypothetical protein
MTIKMKSKQNPPYPPLAKGDEEAKAVPPLVKGGRGIFKTRGIRKHQSRSRHPTINIHNLF